MKLFQQTNSIETVQAYQHNFLHCFA